ncbi:MAG: hypothetical protein A2X94_10530 [Bdellovibrionales bacterium GWB1_55_8]|nr:MAG: hypothetical protein A2X94_10530 [Bdellovibrionales bacterium GWB1_55_8]
MHALVRKLRFTLTKTDIENVEVFHDEVREIQQEFRNLPRTLSETERLISLKFQMQHWRRKALDLTLEFLMKTTDTSGQVRYAIQTLQELALKPSPQVLARWLEKVSNSRNKELIELTANYLATIGEPELLRQLYLYDDSNPAAALLCLAGPRRKLPILANAPSRCSFKTWSADPEFSNYAIDDQGTHYRGLVFRPGDILVANVDRDGNGVYTALQAPRSYGFHLGFFAVLNVNGRPIPSVLESYKLGVRAVPLSTFLAPRFSSYVEVCRLRDLPKHMQEKINLRAARMPMEVKGYNFDTEDPDRSFLACTAVANRLFELAGIQPIATKSRYSDDPQVRKNMDFFDFGADAFLSLTDFIVDPRLQIIGAVDNGHFHRNIARDLCERRFFEIFRRGDIDAGALPWMYSLNRFGVRQMRSGSMLGRLIGLPYMLTPDNLPRGPEKVLAIIEIYEHLVEVAVRRVDRKIQTLWDNTQLVDIDQLASDPAVVDLLEEALAPISRAFNGRLMAKEHSLLP